MNKFTTRDSKGRFGLQREIKKERRKELMRKARKEKAAKHATESGNITCTPKVKIEGKRIVDLNHLGSNLKCHKCNSVLSLENIIEEKRIGLQSKLKIMCNECKFIVIVHTNKMHGDNKHSDVNTAAVLGTIHSGSGYTALNKILACLNIPSMSSPMYKRFEKEVGSAIEESAKESCKKAAKEERRLVIQNIEELCNNL